MGRMKWGIGLLVLSLGVLMVGCKPHTPPCPPVPLSTHTFTSTPSQPVTWTQTPTDIIPVTFTITATRTSTATATFPVTLTGSPTPTGSIPVTFTSTPSRTASISPTPTVPCCTPTWTATPTSACSAPSTFGFTGTAGDVAGAGAVPASFYQRHTASSAGSVYQIHVYFVNAPTQFRAGIYTDNAGNPGTALALSTLVTNVTTGLNIVTIPKTTIATGTPYWLALYCASGPVTFLGAQGTGNFSLQQSTDLATTFGGGLNTLTGQLHLYALVCTDNTPTPSATLTPTFTRTPTPILSLTPTVTPPCNYFPTIWGDSTANPTPTYQVVSGTQAQRYVAYNSFSLGRVVLNLFSTAVSVRVGIYSDNGGSYPVSLLWSSSSRPLAGGPQTITVPCQSFPAGNYWLACGNTGMPMTLLSASGSTALRSTVALDFPSYWLECSTGVPTPTPTPVCTPPISATTGQIVLFGLTFP